MNPDEIRAAARAHSAAREWGRAEKEWKSFLGHVPDDLEAQAGLADALLRLRRLDEAEQIAASAKTHHPTDMRILVPWALISMARKDDTGAIARWKQLVDINAEYFAPHLHLGTIYQRRGNLELARDHLLKAQSLQPDRLDVFLPLARYYVSTGDDQNAADYYLRQLSASPNAEVALEAAEVMLRLGRPAEASALLGKSHQGIADLVRWQAVRFQCDIALQRWSPVLQHIASLAAKGLPEEALSRGYELICGLPESPLQRKFIIARLNGMLGPLSANLARRLEGENKLEAMSELLGDTGNNRDLDLQKAAIFRRLRQYDKAVELCDRLVEADPSDAAALQLLLETKHQAQDWAGVITAMESKLAVSQPVVEDFAMMGEALTAVGNLSTAEDWLNSGLQVHPGCGVIYFRLGVASLWQGEFLRAKSYFRHAATAAVPFPPASSYVELTKWLLDQKAVLPAGDILAACEALTAGAAGSIATHDAKGLELASHIRSLTLQRHYQAAIDIGSEALQSKPGPGPIMDSLLLALLSSAQTSEAVSLIGTNESYFASNEFLSRGRHLLTGLWFSMLNYPVGLSISQDKVAASLLRGIIPPEQELSFHEIDQPQAAGALLLAEGDAAMEITWSRLYPHLSSHANGVRIGCDPRLHSLLQRSFPDLDFTPVVRWTGRGPLPAAREISGYAGLPHLELGRIVDAKAWALLKSGCKAGLLTEFLAAVSARVDIDSENYLLADPLRKRAWRSRLDQLGTSPKIGISWISDGPGLHEPAALPLAQWLPVFKTKGVEFICLQPGNVSDELERAEQLAGITIHEFDDLDLDADFEGVASLASELDLVISVTNCTSELAGAVGARCWIVNPTKFHDWRAAAAGRADILNGSQTHMSIDGADDMDAVMANLSVRLWQLAQSSHQPERIHPDLSTAEVVQLVEEKSEAGFG